MERIREEESLMLPPDIDYLSLPVSLSDEVREVLDRARPDTVSVLLISTAKAQSQQRASVCVHLRVCVFHVNVCVDSWEQQLVSQASLLLLSSTC